MKNSFCPSCNFKSGFSQIWSHSCFTLCILLRDIKKDVSLSSNKGCGEPEQADQCKPMPLNQLPLGPSGRIIHILPTRCLQRETEKEFSIPAKLWKTQGHICRKGRPLYVTQEKEHSRIVLKKLWPHVRFLTIYVREGPMEMKEMDQNVVGKKNLEKKRCKISLVEAYIRKLFNIDYWFVNHIYRQEY